MILPETTLFPQMSLPLRIFEPRYRKMLADVLEGGRMFAVALRHPQHKRETPMTIGGLGLVSSAVTQPDGTSFLTLLGLAVALAFRAGVMNIGALRYLDRKFPKDTDHIGLLTGDVNTTKVVAGSLRNAATSGKPVNVNVLVMNVNAEQIWLSLEDPAGFMAAVSQKTGLAPGPHKPF